MQNRLCTLTIGPDVERTRTTTTAVCYGHSEGEWYCIASPTVSKNLQGLKMPVLPHIAIQSRVNNYDACSRSTKVAKSQFISLHVDLLTEEQKFR